MAQGRRTGTKEAAAVRVDAAGIVERLRAGRATVRGLMKEYGCSYAVLIGVILSILTRAEWRRICRERVAAAGARTRFSKGHAPWNLGIRGVHMSPATEFKPGHIRGSAARRYRPVGAISIRRDGANGQPSRWIKVTDEGPVQYRYIPYARWVWQKERGPIPVGGIVIHMDGDSLNDCVENLRITDRAGNLRRLRTLRPGMEVKRLKASARAARNRRRRQKDIRRIWECFACGGEFAGPHDVCPKCGSAAVEQVSRRLVAVG